MSVEKAQERLKTIIEHTNDKDLLTELANLNSELNHAKEEQDNLSKDLKETQQCYKELILASGVKSEQDPRSQDIETPGQPLDFHDFVVEYASKLNKK